MTFTETELIGAFLISPRRIEDDRGFFERLWCSREFASCGLKANMVQTNLAHSEHAMTLRGLHYQAAPYAEAKLVTCLAGVIYDVIIDLRPDSPTYKQWLGIELNSQEHMLLYVPEGFAHGYLTMEENVKVLYQVSQFYAPEAEKGIRWDDPAFNIDWPDNGPLVISAKDKSWPDFLDVKRNLEQER